MAATRAPMWCSRPGVIRRCGLRMGKSTSWCWTAPSAPL